MSSERRSSLTDVDLFLPLSEEETLDLERRIPSVGLEEGQIFYTPWHRGERFFLLQKGRMRIYRVRGTREVTLSVRHPGEFFGVAGLAGLTQNSWAQALEPARVAIMGRQALRRLNAERPEVGTMMTELLIERLSAYEDRLEEISLKEIPERLACMLVKMVEAEGVTSDEGYYIIPDHYTHQLLATMIGCERPALTRALRDLSKAELIWISGRRIHVHDLKALRRRAEGRGDPESRPAQGPL